jgi:hypothetical protein
MSYLGIISAGSPLFGEASTWQLETYWRGEPFGANPPKPVLTAPWQCAKSDLRNPPLAVDGLLGSGECVLRAESGPTRFASRAPEPAPKLSFDREPEIGFAAQSGPLSRYTLWADHH